MPPEVLGNGTLVVAFGIVPSPTRARRQWCQVKLSAEVSQDGGRDVPIVAENASVLAQHTELHGQAAQVLRPPMLGKDKSTIAFREGPVKGELLVGGMGRHQHRVARRRMLKDSGTGRRLSGRRH